MTLNQIYPTLIKRKDCIPEYDTGMNLFENIDIGEIIPVFLDACHVIE